MTKFMGRALATLVALAGFATSAQASWLPDPTWSHTYVPADAATAHLKGGESVTYRHDLTLDGYRPGTDSIVGALLTIDLYDDSRYDGNEKAAIDVAGIGDGIDVYVTQFDYAFSSWVIRGLAQLNKSGILDITISSVCNYSVCGDFILGSSTLDAWGVRGPSRVPEPGMLGLFGLGLLGVAVGARRRKGRSA